MTFLCTYLAPFNSAFKFFFSGYHTNMALLVKKVIEKKLNLTTTQSEFARVKQMVQVI
jgi:hypothetical protein